MKETKKRRKKNKLTYLRKDKTGVIPIPVHIKMEFLYEVIRSYGEEKGPQSCIETGKILFFISSSSTSCDDISVCFSSSFSIPCFTSCCCC